MNGGNFDPYLFFPSICLYFESKRYGDKFAPVYNIFLDAIKRYFNIMQIF